MKNLKIRTKLFVGFSLMMLIFAAGGVGSAMNVYKANARTAAEFTAAIRPMMDLDKVEVAFSNIRQTSRGFVIRVTADIEQLEPQTKRLQGLIDAMSEATDKYIATMQAFDTPDTILNLTIDVRNVFNSEFKPLIEKMMVLAKDANFKEIVEAMEASNKASNKIFTNMETIYALTVKDMEDTLLENENNARIEMYLTLVFVAVSLVVSILLAFFMSRAITSPLEKILKMLKLAGTGDMRARSLVQQKDEPGIIAKFLDDFFKEMQGIFKHLRDSSDTLFDTSKELLSISEQVSKGTEGAAAKSDDVKFQMEQAASNINAIANGSSQASANAGDVASTAEEMSTNMNAIATAMEEMSASISQISSNTGETHSVARQAREKAAAATEAMNKLGEAASKIGQVTEVIKEIANKTNLLALNATIEAASAGEAGKGFAVVAGEIKELANQSAQSADDIAQRIENIQSGTSNAVTAIKDVASIIANINSSVESIAGYVDQQTKASNEIANNVAQANMGTKRVAGAIGEVARDTNSVNNNVNDIAKVISIVKENSAEASSGAKDGAQGALIVNAKADNLEKIAEELKNSISRFKI